MVARSRVQSSPAGDPSGVTLTFWAPAAGAARKAARKMACAGNCFMAPPVNATIDMLAPSRRRLGRLRILGQAAGAPPDGPVGPANRPDWPPSRARPTERTHTRGGEAVETSRIRGSRGSADGNVGT